MIPQKLRVAWRAPSVRAIARNFGWLASEKAATLAVSLVVSVWLARYLGPAQFGQLNYAVAIVGLFGTFAYLGISGIAVRDLVEKPDERDEVLGTLFVLKLIGALLAILLIVGVVWLAIEERRERALVILLSVGMLFESASVISFWYHSRLEAKYVVAASMFSLIAGAGANVALLLARASLEAFVVVIVAQQGLNTAGLLYLYRAGGLSVARWQFRISRAKSLLKQSWPLMLASMGSVIYLKIDQVMIGHMLGHSEVGVYAVAVRFSEVWYFIPTALAASLFPRIVKLKALPDREYRAGMERMYRFMVVAAIAVAIPVTLSAEPLIAMLYGSSYDGAARVLMIHIWACPAIFMAAVLSKWLISEELYVFSLTRHGFGAASNVALNVALIPRFGPIGAAVATVVSYTVASYLACFSDRRTAATGVMMTKALLMPFKGLLNPAIAPRSDTTSC
jgi:O-antigen/teichoic acid export membrane protein